MPSCFPVLTGRSFNVDHAVDSPDLIDDPVEFFPASDFKGSRHSRKPLLIRPGIHRQNINVFLSQCFGNIRQQAVTVIGKDLDLGQLFFSGSARLFLPFCIDPPHPVNVRHI